MCQGRDNSADSQMPDTFSVSIGAVTESTSVGDEDHARIYRADLGALQRRSETSPASDASPRSRQETDHKPSHR